MKYKGPLSTVNGKILLRIAVVDRDTLQHRRLVFLVVKIDSLITVQMTEVDNDSLVPILKQNTPAKKYFNEEIKTM